MPHVGSPAEGSGVGEHAAGAGEVLGQPHDRLAVLVRHDLADGSLRSRRLALDPGGDGAQSDQPQELLLDVQVSQPLTMWPENIIGTSSEIRAHYIAAIIKANDGNYDDLIAMHRQFADANHMLLLFCQNDKCISHFL